MQVLIVQHGMSIQQAYEIQKSSLLGSLEIDSNLSDKKITELLKIIENSAKNADVYGIINNEAIPIKEVDFIKDYYARINKKSTWKFWKKDKVIPEELLYSGGDGLSSSEPIILNCYSMPMARNLVDRYLSKQCQEGWKITQEATLQVVKIDEATKKLREISVLEPNGNEKKYYFDFNKPMSNDLHVNALKKNLRKNIQ